VRAARRRHEALGLTVEEAAFYDALAGDTESPRAEPKIAEISQALVTAIRNDLSVDWADREATEAAIRVKIKRLLRRFGFKAEPAGGAGRLEWTTDLVLDQARTLYRNWPHIAASGIDVLIP
jgi:type I restriction enzyme R subunit